MEKEEKKEMVGSLSRREFIDKVKAAPLIAYAAPVVLTVALSNNAHAGKGNGNSGGNSDDNSDDNSDSNSDDNSDSNDNSGLSESGNGGNS